MAPLFCTFNKFKSHRSWFNCILHDHDTNRWNETQRDFILELHFIDHAPMARKKRQGSTRRRPSATEVELSPDVKEDVRRMKRDLNLCVRYASTSTELKKILERIKSSSLKDISCLKCDDDISESAFLWLCLDCKHIFCGDEDVFGPTGHIFDDTRVGDHLGCMRLDMPNKIYVVLLYVL